MPFFQISIKNIHRRQVSVEANDVNEAIKKYMPEQLDNAQWLDLEHSQEITSVKELIYKDIPKEDYEEMLEDAF